MVPTTALLLYNTILCCGTQQWTSAPVKHSAITRPKQFQIGGGKTHQPYTILSTMKFPENDFA